MNVMFKAPAPARVTEGAEQREVSLEARRAVRQTVLAYHELTPEVASYTYALNCGEFAEHMLLLHSLQQGSDNDKPPVTVSFDDGHISNYTQALPLLEEHSCKATFFVIAGRIGERKEFMTWAQLKEMTALGHRIESHSWSHRFLTECSDADLCEELVLSKTTLEDRLGISVEAISAPHGRWDRRVLQACAKAGYRRFYTSDPWSRSAGEVEVVGRLVMNRGLGADQLLHWLTMGSLEAGFHRTRYALKRSVQRILGKKLYYRLWTRFSGWQGVDDSG